MKRYTVGVLGATGMVGQRFVTLLASHPWFSVGAVAASPSSAGKTYAEAVAGRWAMEDPIPPRTAALTVLDATADRAAIAESVDFVFSAMAMKKGETKLLEEGYAKLECPVISNDSAHRFTPDVPMLIPEVNPQHAEVIPYFRKRMGLKRGLIAVKSNCSLQSYLPALHPLWEFGVERVLACTYQAISGAGKNFGTWPEMVDNVIPLIPGEEEKSELEPLKIWGKIEDGVIVPASEPSITTQCIRVPVSDGHMAAVFASFAKTPPLQEVVDRWNTFSGIPQALALPSAPKKFIHYFTEADRPQTKLDRGLENGMAVSAGRLREDTQYDIKFVSLSHNTLRGAAGGGILAAELLCAEGYIE
ncbi:MAG: aspartate-semialdehyde dehydrogenase [Oscillospiraceae bacterium]|jgi:aspartate-semialdehyde dehydrogenase|nr:aspartate-semialdehyde dehydrogenase [Oscillospiraceae bacterium]